MFLLWHPSLTAINLSYTFPILETSATALCGTTGIHVSYVDSEFFRCMWYILNYIFIISYSTNILRISMIMTLDTHALGLQICLVGSSLKAKYANCGDSLRDPWIKVKPIASAPETTKLLLWTYPWKNMGSLKKKNGSKMIKAERDVNSCLNTRQTVRDLKGPECPCYVSQVPSQWLLGRLWKKGSTRSNPPENAKYKQCIDQCKTHVAHTYMLIWKNTMQIHNMSMHQSFSDNIASCWCKFPCFCGPN